MNQMKASWIRDGTIWMKVMDRHDQSLWMLAVPHPMQETSSAPAFHRQL